MKKTVLFYCFAAGALAGTALACSQSPPPLQKASQDQSKGDDDDNGKSAAAPAAAPSPPSSAAAASAAPPAAAPSDAGAAPAGSGTSGALDPLEAAYDQCMTQCIGANPASLQIQNADNACFDKCNEADLQCLTRCEQLSDRECQSNTAACGVLAQCDNNCSAQVGF